jgi:toxin ParE1/3/4
MQVRFHPEARNDLIVSAAYYAKASPALAMRFYEHVERLLRDIAADATRYREFRPPARRHFRRPFPYAVVFVCKPDCIWVLAVMHFKRPPSYWAGRLDD